MDKENEILFGHKKEILSLKMNWMDLESFIINKISETEKHKFCTLFLIYEI